MVLDFNQSESEWKSRVSSKFNPAAAGLYRKNFFEFG